MRPTTAIAHSHKILESAGQDPELVMQSLRSFPEYLTHVALVFQDLPPTARGNFKRQRWFRDWVEAWAELKGEFEAMRAADPGAFYTPMHRVSSAFHQSMAFIRYYRAGNRTSKTQSGAIEHYWAVTGQHPFRKLPPPPHNTFIVCGMPYVSYSPKVFEPKFVKGEPGNSLSPLFPSDGKWFYHYDERRKILTIRCPECAETKPSGECPPSHPKSQIMLFSSEMGIGVLEGFTATLGHADEDIPQPYWNAMLNRVGDNPNSYMLLTATPLAGPAYWANSAPEEGKQSLVEIAQGPPEHNIYNKKTGQPFVELFTIDQYAAGIVPHHKIDADIQQMDEFEVEARVYGKPSNIAENPVFDRAVMADMRTRCADPGYLTLSAKPDLPPDLPFPYLGEHILAEDIQVSRPGNWTGLRIWERPEGQHQYVIAVDSARGLTHGDASCASVIKLGKDEFGQRSLELVAQYWGWINPYDYGAEVYKLALWYNRSIVIIELTGGFGDGVLNRLRYDYQYSNIYAELSRESQIDPNTQRLGVETNAQTKPIMVAALQAAVRERGIKIPCKHTIAEMVAFEQQNTSRGGELLIRPKFQGSRGSKDDRVMSLAIGVSTIWRRNLVDFSEELSQMSQSVVPPGLKVDPPTREDKQEWDSFEEQWQAQAAQEDYYGY